MSDYKMPVQDMVRVLTQVLDWGKIQSLEGYNEATPEMVSDILNGTAEYANNILAPLNQTSDKEGSKYDAQTGDVKTASGLKDAYKSFCELGLSSIASNPLYGGLGMPWVLSMAVAESIQSANVGFSLAPLLTQGASSSIEAFGSDAQKEFYLPKLFSGTWTGTMNLTEPQAGSDLAQVKTKAVKQNDGTFKIYGQKIFITFGEHDMTDNIIHLVLARTPEAPEGIKGISLFVVPKFLENGTRNDVKCTGIEHKLGIHASPTCTMQYGDKDGAIGYLIGEENQGIVYMFKMMNHARLFVGLQGIGVCERAYQDALAYAIDRKQGTSFDGETNASIIKHPDVARMLLTMKSITDAGRANTYLAGYFMDIAEKSTDKAEKQNAHDWVSFLTPIVKAWNTEAANEVSSLGIQVHGGMGYIEETGAAQHLRDARILAIYEGTNGIQAKDLVFRKIIKEGAPALENLIQELTKLEKVVENKTLKKGLKRSLDDISKIKTFIAENSKNPKTLEAASFNIMMVMGYSIGNWMMTRIALADSEKSDLSEFFADHILPRNESLLASILGSSGIEKISQNVFKNAS